MRLVQEPALVAKAKPALIRGELPMLALETA
jgi:hypothetical protein